MISRIGYFLTALLMLLLPLVAMLICAFSQKIGAYFCRNPYLKSNIYQAGFWLSLLVSCLFILMVVYGLLTDCAGTAGVYVAC